MYIKNFQLKNYKSFRDSGPISLERGFNLIVGKNDAGKSALLESLRPGMPFRPHRSMQTAPDPSTPPVQTSLSIKTFGITAEDVRFSLSRHETIGLPTSSNNVEDAKRAFEIMLKNPSDLVATWHNEVMAEAFMAADGRGLSSLAIRNAGSPTRIDLTDYIPTGIDSYARVMTGVISGEIYGFNAERYRMGSSSAGGGRVLANDASNLPEVLNKLADDPATLEEFLNHVRLIFPHITYVSSALEGNQAHIRIWSYPVESRRRDLAVPLADSGSGIGQVLAMLYVAVTAERPKVILIDEPQSFLHPGAIRKLFEILSGYSAHQYVITTHSPTGLSLTSATNMLLVERGEHESHVTRLDPTSQKSVGVFLTHIGARLADIFGADNILWVEGKTEEICFPLLIREVAKRTLGGTQIVGIVNTGDLEGSLAERVVSIYERLSKGSALLPPAVAFLFDAEGKTEKQRREVERRTSGLIRWLPRRMFENYLMEPAAVCHLLNSEDQLRSEPVTVADVKAWFVSNGESSKYFPAKLQLAYGDEGWLESVDGAALLLDLIYALSDTRVKFDKVAHGELLTRYLITNPNEEISELAAFLADLCGGIS